MKQKKTLKIWQFIISECLLALMIVTMFLPLISIKGSTIANGAKKMLESSGTLGNIAGTLVGDQFDALADEVDNAIKDYEEEHHVTVSKISPFNIISKSCASLVLGDDAKDKDTMEEINSDETFAGINMGYNVLRIIFCVVYGLMLIVMILNTVAFLAKIVKYIPLGVDIACGFLSLIFFGYIRFGLMKKALSISMDLMDGGMDLLGLGFGSVISTDQVQSMALKMLNSLYGKPFMILILGASLLLVISSVVFMFVGQSAVEKMPSANNHIPEPAISPVSNRTPVTAKSAGTPTPMVTPAPTPVINQTPVTPAPTPVVNQTPVTPAPAPTAKSAATARQAMGQVRVVKGVATGQGFALPQDKKVIVGKNPQRSNLVIADQHVSNIHCSIRYVQATNHYIVKDHSSNGTFVNGVRLQKDTAMEYPAGTLLSLADGNNEILLE